MVSQSGVGDLGVAAVGALTGLRMLDLTNNWAITDDGVGALTSLRELESLNLTGSNQARDLHPLTETQIIDSVLCLLLKTGAIRERS